jgi:ABC-type lipoprotein export system ATPase subunit
VFALVPGADLIQHVRMSAGMTFLKLDNVVKQFPAPDGAAALAVIDGVSLDVARGESLAITGPSGSGKSTLLQIIGALDRPTSGSVFLEGRDLAGLDDPALTAVRNRGMGFVFQFHFLLPQCTVWENVLVPSMVCDDAAIRKAAPGRARRLLQRVGLGERLGHRPGQLSGGERQRAAVVRALVNQPALLLADEPTGALDHASAQAMGRLLVELNREEKVTLIVVTHSGELACSMGRMLELRDGKLKAMTGQ